MQKQLHAFWKKGWPDRKIALRLNREAMRLGLAANWTKRRVQLWRLRNSLPAHPRNSRWPARRRETWLKRRAHAIRHGWRHLLAGPEEVRVDASHRVSVIVLGYNLRPREIDVLSALRDLGPLTRSQIIARLGVTSQITCGGVDTLRRLCDLGLLSCSAQNARGAKKAYVYSLALRATVKKVVKICKGDIA